MPFFQPIIHNLTMCGRVFNLSFLAAKNVRNEQI